MNIGKLYNHDPKHFRFERRCDDFEPDANDGDKFVIGVSVAIAFFFFCAMAVNFVARFL